MDTKDRIIVALDVPDVSSALLIMEQTHEYVGCYKVGLELICAQEAARVISRAKSLGVKIFFDAKLNDIPTTVGRTVAAIANDVDMINVHALAGHEAMVAAVKNAGLSCKILAVTILTSLTIDDLKLLGFECSGEYTDQHLIESIVCKLAKAAMNAGVYGLICSPKELAALKREKIHLRTVTPGVRPTWAVANDQKRIMTPTDAIQAGADHLVIGRPITNPPENMSRAQAVKLIYEEIAQASMSSTLGSASSPL